MTEADVPGLVSVWNSAFASLAIQTIFLDTPTRREWRQKSFERSMHSPTQNCIHMVGTDDSKDGTRKVLAFGRWFRYSEGGFEQDWRSRWEPVFAEDMRRYWG
jgi:hypothetical protein